MAKTSSIKWRVTVISFVSKTLFASDEVPNTTKALPRQMSKNVYTHTHTHIYIYICMKFYAFINANYCLANKKFFLKTNP